MVGGTTQTQHIVALQSYNRTLTMLEGVVLEVVGVEFRSFNHPHSGGYKKVPQTWSSLLTMQIVKMQIILKFIFLLCVFSVACCFGN